MVLEKNSFWARRLLRVIVKNDTLKFEKDQPKLPPIKYNISIDSNLGGRSKNSGPR
jgi:hypothetical protein